MAEKNPLLIKKSLSADQTSLSSATSDPAAYTPNHPPAEIVNYKSPINSVNHSPLAQRQKQEGSARSRTTDNIRRIPRSRSPNSSRSGRSRTDKITSYNLEYRGKIPLASKLFFVFLSFGISLTIIAMAASAYLTLDPSHCKGHSDIANIVLPLVIYVMNVVECSLFYLEARNFQMKGYTQLFQDASKLSKINFRFMSVYYVAALALYGYLLHHEAHLLTAEHERDDIFLGIWFFAYLFIIGCLCNFGKKFYVHNREQPKPDLFFPNPNNQNYVQNSPLIRGSKQDGTGSHNVLMVDDQTEVIQKLYKDKATLMRQLDSMKKKYDRTNRELQQIQNDNVSSILGVHAGGGGAMTGNIAIKSDVTDLKKQIQKLRSKVRSEREQIKTLSTGIETKKTMLEAQKSETQQLRNVLHAKDDRIQELMNDKEALERGINACSDQKDELELQCQVKDQEVEIAKKENERLRKKIQLHQMSMQNNQDY